MFTCKRCKENIRGNWRYCEKCTLFIANERNKKYRQSTNGKKMFRKYQLKYEQTNKKRREYRKNWLKNNKDKIKIYNQNYYKKRILD